MIFDLAVVVGNVVQLSVHTILSPLTADLSSGLLKLYST